MLWDFWHKLTIQAVVCMLRDRYSTARCNFAFKMTMLFTQTLSYDRWSVHHSLKKKKCVQEKIYKRVLTFQNIILDCCFWPRSLLLPSLAWSRMLDVTFTFSQYIIGICRLRSWIVFLSYDKICASFTGKEKEIRSIKEFGFCKKATEIWWNLQVIRWVCQIFWSS